MENGFSMTQVGLKLTTMYQRKKYKSLRKKYKSLRKKYKTKDDITGGWFEGHIRKLNSLGIMQGEGNGVFAPYRNVTRAGCEINLECS